jgi:antitoxin component of MazEF toxin-antitoxin module
MALTKRISPVGNSAGLTIDRPILRQVGWEMGTEVEVRVEGEAIILTKHRNATTAELATSAKRMIARHRKSLEKLSE